MTTSRLISIALAGAVLAVPAAAQAAPSKPPSHLRLNASTQPKAVNPKAKKKVGKAKIRARSAWVYDGSIGRPGSVTETSPISVVDLPLWAGTTVGYVYQPALMSNHGPVVSRSPASGAAQDISIVYSIQRWSNGQWVQYSSAGAAVRLGAGYSTTRLPYLARFPNPPKGSVRVVEYIYWFAAGTNTLLGGTAIAPHTASDHACVTRTRCVANPGWVQLG